MSTARVGHLLVLGYRGLRVPDAVYAFARRFGLGGIILFARNAGPAAAVRGALEEFRCRLQAVDPHSPALVLVDQEGGRVERLRDGVPHLAAARELAALGEGAFRDRVAAQAKALAALGIDVNLAPVCDVVQAGESGAIGDRAYGGEPAAVARWAALHVRTSLEQGILPCAKHFPGHGAAQVDSHARLPLLARDWEQLQVLDLVPFRAAIEAGAPLVMAGHLAVPAVAAAPATLAGYWLDEVLRRQLGFSGAVISDDMEMGALRELGAPAEVAARAVGAGCDLLIYGRQLRPELDVDAVAQDLVTHLNADGLAAAHERVCSLREKLA